MISLSASPDICFEKKIAETSFHLNFLSRRTSHKDRGSKIQCVCMRCFSGSFYFLFKVGGDLKKALSMGCGARSC